MRVLLDECLPRRLKHELPEHDVRTVPEMGWASKSNGELLELAAGRFDAFLTVDRGIQYQQNLSSVRLGIIPMLGPSNDIDDLRPLMPAVNRTLQDLSAGEFKRVSA